MHRQMKRLLVASVILTFSFSCSSTRKVPRPELEICTHIVEEAKAICVNNVNSDVKEIPIENTDKYILMDVSMWGRVLSHIEKVESRKDSPSYKIGLRELGRRLRRTRAYRNAVRLLRRRPYQSAP
jgi:hypothetical protein